MEAFLYLLCAMYVYIRMYMCMWVCYVRMCIQLHIYRCVLHIPYACVLPACKLLHIHTRLLYSNEIVSIVSLTPDGVSGHYHSVAFVTPGTLYLVANNVDHRYCGNRFERNRCERLY